MLYFLQNFLAESFFSRSPASPVCSDVLNTCSQVTTASIPSESTASASKELTTREALIEEGRVWYKIHLSCMNYKYRALIIIWHNDGIEVALSSDVVIVVHSD